MTGIGAQFGGKYFCHDVRVVRLPRHGASCPVGIGVSCSADRQVSPPPTPTSRLSTPLTRHVSAVYDPACSFVQALGKITADGVFLEQLETDPSKYMPEIDESAFSTQVVQVSDARR